LLPTELKYEALKSALEDWFFRLQRSQMFVPPGTIVEFGGTVPPEGWVECDGTEYQQEKYPLLYKEIGQTYGGAAGTFEVPPTTATTVGQIWIIKV